MNERCRQQSVNDNVVTFKILIKKKTSISRPPFFLEEISRVIGPTFTDRLVYSNQLEYFTSLQQMDKWPTD